MMGLIPPSLRGQGRADGAGGFLRGHRSDPPPTSLRFQFFSKMKFSKFPTSFTAYIHGVEIEGEQVGEAILEYRSLTARARKRESTTSLSSEFSAVSASIRGQMCAQNQCEHRNGESLFSVCLQNEVMS